MLDNTLRGVRINPCSNSAAFASPGDISSILFFLLGAMATVELIDTHSDFAIIAHSITAYCMLAYIFPFSPAGYSHNSHSHDIIMCQAAK